MMERVVFLIILKLLEKKKTELSSKARRAETKTAVPEPEMGDIEIERREKAGDRDRMSNKTTKYFRLRLSYKKKFRMLRKRDLRQT